MFKTNKPREFWVLDNPKRPYPTCYRGEPTWDEQTDPRVVHCREVSAPSQEEKSVNPQVLRDQLTDSNKRVVDLEGLNQEMLEALKGVLAVADRNTKEFDAARAVIAKAEGAQ
jgi:hypothetical protein